MYIGRVTVSQNWADVEELMKQKISDFAFDKNKTYQLTAETLSDSIRLCVYGELPTDLYAGDLFATNQAAIYKCADGEHLYCRLENAFNEATLKVSEIG